MSDLYTRFIANLVFPLQERVKKHDTVRVRRQMEESQWWSAERIAALQVEQQVLIPQLHISVNREAAARVGFTPATLTVQLAVALAIANPVNPDSTRVPLL